MKKETIEIKVAYQAPEVKTYNVKPSVAMMSYGTAGAAGANFNEEEYTDFE